jgi:hypothetical protein
MKEPASKQMADRATSRGDVPSKRRLAFNELHGVICQSIRVVHFIDIAVRASDPTNVFLCYTVQCSIVPRGVPGWD